MAYEHLILNREDDICILTINRPKALNALNTEVLDELAKMIEEIEEDKSIRVCIVTGGGKAFVAGADISEMSNLDPMAARLFGQRGNQVFSALESMDIPVIAAINGYALGGGCELALACDIRLASEKAKLGQPEVTLGITPGFGGTQRLARIVGPARAKELIYTGKMIDAQTAKEIGLVNHVHPAEELMEEAKKMAREIAKQAPLAVQFCKGAINQGLDLDIQSGLDLESNLFGLCFATHDQREGMQAFLEKRKIDFKGE